MKPLPFCLAAVFSVSLPYSSLKGAVVEIELPTDYIVGYDSDNSAPAHGLAGNSTNSPGAELPVKAIDNVIAGSKYLNNDSVNSGFVLQTARIGVVTGLQFSTANDSPDRDPLTYRLEGTKDAGQNWSLISTGSTGITGSTTRNTKLDPVAVTNSQFYSAYRLTFPTLSNSTAAMQIADVNFLTDSSRLRSNILGVGSTITPVGTYTPGGGGSEGVANLLDGNTGTKLFDSSIVDGFTYNLNPKTSPSIVNGLRLATGNDNANNGRNPLSFTLRGSNDGVIFSDIVSMSSPNLLVNQLFYDFAFENETKYSSYQIYFPGLHPNGALASNGLQISELQLLGVVPEPSRAVLGLGILAISAFRRRR